MRRQIDARIIQEGKRLGMVGSNLAQPRVHRECHFDDFVEDRLVSRCTEGTPVYRPGDGLKGGIRVNHAAATGQRMFQRRSNNPSRVACSKPAITRSSSSFARPAKSSG